MNDENVSFEEMLNDSMKKQNKLDKVVTGKVISVSNNGEVFVDIDYKADGIIPKAEFSFDENENPKDVVKPGDILTCQVLKMNDGEGNVLLSCKKERAAGKKKEKEETINSFWDNVKVGDKFEGTVASVCSYGAFIAVNDYVQGLLHISEMSWDRNAKAQDILKQGQTIKVTVKDLDRENKRIQLAYEGKGANPWDLLDAKVGDIIKVKIKNLVPFGAFAEVKKGVEGLIHISQISTKRITKPNEVLSTGEIVNAKIIELDIPNRKMELSIKELEGTSSEYSSKDKDEVEAKEEANNEEGNE